MRHPHSLAFSFCFFSSFSVLFIHRTVRFGRWTGGGDEIRNESILHLFVLDLHLLELCQDVSMADLLIVRDRRTSTDLEDVTLKWGTGGRRESRWKTMNRRKSWLKIGPEREAKLRRFCEVCKKAGLALDEKISELSLNISLCFTTESWKTQNTIRYRSWQDRNLDKRKAYHLWLTLIVQI